MVQLVVQYYHSGRTKGICKCHIVTDMCRYGSEVVCVKKFKVAVNQ